jgi:hypothetical protein
MIKDIEKPDFNFFVGMDSDELEKSAKKTKDTGRYDKMIIQGVASDNSEDTDSETLEPKGFVLSRFLKMGFINWDHRSKDDPRFFIGEPIDAKVVNNKFLVKAKLYKENPIARNLWDSMIMLKAANSTRRAGFSIEGKALERDLQNPKRITKALITGLAATMNPKNGNSFADIVKGKYSDPIVKEYKYEGNEAANRGQITYLVDITNHETGIRYTIDKNLHLKVEKAMNSVNARPLIREDLERKLKVLPFGDVKAALVNIAKAKRDGRIKKSLFDEIKRNIDIYKKYI